MTLRLESDEFGTLAKSGVVDAALREPDFLRKAVRLFDLREKIWDAFSATSDEIDNAGFDAAERSARWPGRIAFGIGAVAAGTALAMAAFAVTPMVLAMSAGAALIGGFSLRGIARWVAKIGPETAADDAQDEMSKQRKAMHNRIETAIKEMDSNLLSQNPGVREEFRSAFRHAAMKQEVRENRAHRAKVEQKAEETAEAAQTAATMSSIAAMNSALATMRR